MFSTSADIANRAAQHLGQPRITTLGDGTKMSNEISFAYDKIRQAELNAHVWRFATRKAAIRPITSTTKTLTWGNWAIGTTYVQGDIINDPTANAGNSGTSLYISLVASNLGNTPSSSPTKWTPYFGANYADTYSASSTYSAGEIVLDTSYYLSLSNGNIAQARGSAPWSSALTSPTGTTLFVPYPVAQFSNGTTRSVYLLPYGYMRIAPQDPKAAGVANQTVSAGMQFADFQLEGNYLLTNYTPAVVASGGPLVLRFCADISDVTQMNSQFCEAFAVRMAFDLCETMTQKADLKQGLAARYTQIIMSAKRDNMLETGSTDPEEADYLTSRVPNMPAAQQGR